MWRCLNEDGLNPLPPLLISAKKKPLIFLNVDAGSLAFFSLNHSLQFMQDNYIFQIDRFDALCCFGFIFSYDLGVIR